MIINHAEHETHLHETRVVEKKNLTQLHKVTCKSND